MGSTNTKSKNKDQKYRKMFRFVFEVRYGNGSKQHDNAQNPTDDAKNQHSDAS